MFIVALIAVLHEAVLGLRFFLEREQTLLSTATHKSSLSAAIEERRQAGSSTRGYVNEPAEEEAKPVKQEVRNEVREIFRFLSRIIEIAKNIKKCNELIYYQADVHAFPDVASRPLLCPVGPLPVRLRPRPMRHFQCAPDCGRLAGQNGRLSALHWFACHGIS